jgi:flagellin
MAAKNASDGLSMLATIENATNDVTDMLQRIRELAVQAVNDTNGGTDRGYLQLEVNSLLAEIDRVGTQTVYNNKTLLNGSLSGNVQVGTESGQNIQFSISSIQTTDIGTAGTAAAATASTDMSSGTYTVTVGSKAATITGAAGLSISDIQTVLDSKNIDATVSGADNKTVVITAGNNVSSIILDDGTSAVTSNPTGSASALSSIDITTSAKATTALATITSAIEQVAGHRASYGALQNRLEYTVSNLMNVAEFTTAARSRIEDADFAAESAKLAKAQVLQQTGTAMLAQANAASQLALQLIR